MTEQESRRDFRMEHISLEDLTATDLRRETGPRLAALPTPGPVAYLVEVEREPGGQLETEAAQVLVEPAIGRIGIAWGGDAQWSGLAGGGDLDERVRRSIDDYLNDPDAWEARA